MQSSTLTKEELYVNSLFESVLNKSNLPLEEDFFSLGGESIDVVQLLFRIEKETGIQIQGIEFMNACAIKSFAKFLVEEHGVDFSNKIVGLENNTQEVKLNNQLDAPQLYSAENKASTFSSYSSLKVFTIRIAKQILNSFKSKEEKKDSSSKTLIRDQLRLLKSWKGERLTSKGLSIGKNLQGKQPFLFWCFQSYNELDNLSQALGESQPLLGLRSGHLLFKFNTPLLQQLANSYVEEILLIQPQGPFILGGNCQGGKVAWEMALRLKELGHEVGILFSMEVNRKDNFDSPIVLIFGEDSEDFNPYLFEKDPEAEWNKSFKDYSVEILKGKHGSYFEGENIVSLAKLISKHIEKRKKDCFVLK